MILRRAALIVPKDRVHFPDSLGRAWHVLRSEPHEGRWLLETKRGKHSFAVRQIVHEDDLIQMAAWLPSPPIDDETAPRIDVSCISFPGGGTSLCGRCEGAAFIGPDQALDNATRGGKIRACPDCVDAFNLYVRRLDDAP